MAPLTYISLFSGGAGLDLGLDLALPGSRPLAYVEREREAAEVLVARIKEGSIADAPVWSDVSTFDCRRYRGRVGGVVGGFPCFVAGTHVLTTSGYRPIETVAVGDEVLTHRGRWRKVTSAMRRDGAELVSLRGGGMAPTTCTAEHPYWAISRGRRWDNDRRMYVRQFSEPDWVDAGNLTDHFTGRTLPQPEESEWTKEQWWIIGRYLADGWRVRRLKTGKGNPTKSDQGRVVICAAGRKIDELRAGIIQAGFTIAGESRERTVTKFHIVNQRLYRFLEQFGHYAHGKTIPRVALGLDAEKCASLLDGLLAGDGSRRKSGRVITTVSQSLALGIAVLCQRAYGVVASVSTCKRPATAVIKGRVVNQRSTWTVQIPDRNRSSFMCGEWGWSLVRSVEPAGVGTVYNLSVEEDESYFANGACVHNCQDLSVAGSQAGILAGEHSGLWWQFLRIIRETEAQWALIENVPGLFNAPGGDLESDEPENGESAEQSFRNIDAVLGPLSEIGFDAEWITVPASGVGAAHRRNRVFILAYRPGARLSWGQDAGTDSGDAGAYRGWSIESPGSGIELGQSEHANRRAEHQEHGQPYGWPGSGWAGSDVVHSERSERWPGSERRGNGEPQRDGSGKTAGGVRYGDALLGDAGRERDERRGEPGDLVRTPGTAERDGEQRERGGNTAGDLGGELGNAAPGGRGERGEGIAAAQRTGASIFLPGPGLGGAGVLDDIRKLYTRSPREAWRAFEAERENTRRWEALLVRYPWMQPAISQEEAESYFHNLPDDLARLVADQRTAALRLTGNGVVSLQAAVCFRVLARRAGLI